MKQLGDLWQHYPELQEIQGDSNGSEKWLWMPAIANRTSRDPEIMKRCLKCAYVNRLAKLKWKKKSNKWYTSSDVLEAKKLLDNGCPQLEEGIDYEAMGLKWYRGLVMPLGYYHSMDDSIHANQRDTIWPIVLPANNGIPPANPGIHIPPPSSDTSKTLPLVSSE